MKISMSAVSLLLVLAVSACGDSSEPQAQLDAIKEKLAKNLPMSPQQKSEVEQLMTQGSRLLAANKTQEASAAFEQALKMLKAAEDADRFNKAE
jgi:Tfp pilus assembly protein PilF